MVASARRNPASIALIGEAWWLYVGTHKMADNTRNSERELNSVQSCDTMQLEQIPWVERFFRSISNRLSDAELASLLLIILALAAGSS
jgi:hypothetical protein